MNVEELTAFRSCQKHSQHQSRTDQKTAEDRLFQCRMILRKGKCCEWYRQTVCMSAPGHFCVEKWYIPCVPALKIQQKQSL